MSAGRSLCQVQAKPIVFGHVVPCHPSVVLPLRLAEALALETEYGRHLVSSEWWRVQSYCCRGIRGTGGPVTPEDHSEHAHCEAFDVNPPSNPMRDDGVLITDFATFGLEDGVAFVMSWYRAGFRWGGIWTEPWSFGVERQVRWALANRGRRVRNGRVDTMHFELELTPAQVAARDFRGEIRRARAPQTGGDDMAGYADGVVARRSGRPQPDKDKDPQGWAGWASDSDVALIRRELAFEADALGIARTNRDGTPKEGWEEELATRRAAAIKRAT